MRQDDVMAMIVPHVEPSSAKVCIYYVSNPNYVTVKQQAIKSSEQGAYYYASIIYPAFYKLRTCLSYGRKPPTCLGRVRSNSPS